MKKIPAEWLIAVVIGLVHLMVAGRYDIFRNELYFIVCGRHPDFGFVDQPSLVPLLAAATQLFGDNPLAIAFVGQFGVPYAMPYEKARPIFICRGLRRNLSEIWGRLKRYE